jgi:rhodanese-related sulfurtransferase
MGIESNRMVRIGLLATLAAITFPWNAEIQSASAAAPPAAKAPAQEGWKDVDVAGFEKLIKEKDAILDVRTPGEFASGHIAGAVNVNLHGDDFDQKIGQLNKDQPYLVYCATGGRSARACQQMAKLGFKTLYNLQGGITSWKHEGKAVEK